MHQIHTKLHTIPKQKALLSIKKASTNNKYRNYAFSAFCNSSIGTISSLKVYAPVLGDFTALITFAKFLPAVLSRSVATTFFAILVSFYNVLIQLILQDSDKIYEPLPSELFNFFMSSMFLQEWVIFL